MSPAGYAGKVLRVDLSSGRLTDTPTADYSEGFRGGRGLAARVYWEPVQLRRSPGL